MGGNPLAIRVNLYLLRIALHADGMPRILGRDGVVVGVKAGHVHFGAEPQKDSVRTSAVALISGCNAHPKKNYYLFS